MSTVKTLDTDTLARLNRKAIRLKLNRAFDWKRLGPAIDPDGTHVIAWSMIHNDDHLRTYILLKMKGQDEPVNGFLDMTFEDYGKLPDHELPDKVEA